MRHISRRYLRAKFVIAIAERPRTFNELMTYFASGHPRREVQEVVDELLAAQSISPITVPAKGMRNSETTAYQLVNRNTRGLATSPLIPPSGCPSE